jgi:hypothetical protein
MINKEVTGYYFYTGPAFRTRSPGPKFLCTEGFLNKEFSYILWGITFKQMKYAVPEFITYNLKLSFGPNTSGTLRFL